MLEVEYLIKSTFYLMGEVINRTCIYSGGNGISERKGRKV